jgi:Protein of unknown function (DUF1826)
MVLSKLLKWTKPAEHYYYAPAVADLAAIQQRPINIAIHERKPPEDLKESIHSLVNSSFKGFELTVRVDNEVRLQMERSFIDKSILPIHVLNPLIEDIELLIYQFAAICKAEQVRVHLKTIVNDACRKFHIDGYDLRLLCSYAGPGTEWTYNENVNRKYLGEGTNEQIIKDRGYINQLKSYDVVILKGELPHKRTGNGIVHRSPAIEQIRERRLVLRIDC